MTRTEDKDPKMWRTNSPWVTKEIFCLYTIDDPSDLAKALKRSGSNSVIQARRRFEKINPKSGAIHILKKESPEQKENRLSKFIKESIGEDIEQKTLFENPEQKTEIPIEPTVLDLDVKTTFTLYYRGAVIEIPNDILEITIDKGRITYL